MADTNVAIKLYKTSSQAKRVGINVTNDTDTTGYALYVNGATNISGALSASSLSLTTALPVAQGGTGATTTANAQKNLGILPIFYSALDFTVTDADPGIYPIAGTTNPVTSTAEYGSVIQFSGSTASRKYYAAQLIIASASGASTPTHMYVRRMTSTPAWGVWSTVFDNRSNLIPAANTTYDIGSSSAKYSNVYATTFNGALSGNATNVTGTIAVDHGGTGATTAAAARTNLGIGASGTHADSYFALASHTHSYAGSSSAGGAATNVNVTTKSTGSQHYLHCSTGNSGSQATCASADAYLYLESGAVSLNIGGSSTEGRVTFRSNTSYYVNLIGATATANRTITLPNATGTVSLEGHKHAAGDITSGSLAIARGGTGATTAAGARNNLEIWCTRLKSSVGSTEVLITSDWSGYSSFIIGGLPSSNYYASTVVPKIELRDYSHYKWQIADEARYIGVTFRVDGTALYAKVSDSTTSGKTVDIFGLYGA